MTFERLEQFMAASGSDCGIGETSSAISRWKSVVRLGRKKETK
jgi:hypothetical protein